MIRFEKKLKPENKTLFVNFLSLVVLQGINFLSPLVVYPYIVRVIEVENFGIVAFAQTVVMYFNIIVDFGFNIYATQLIAINRDDEKEINDIFNRVMSIKVILLVVSFLVLMLIVGLIDTLKENMLVYLFSFGFVFGQAMFPLWFFQGMEKMKFITLFNAVAKILFIVATFIFVKTKSDFVIVPLLNSMGYILVGVFSLWFILRNFNLEFHFVGLSEMKKTMGESFHFFLSRVSNEGSQYLATFVIGAFYGNKTVGYYSMAEKLYKAIYAMLQPINQALYPYMSKQRNLKIFKKIFYTVLVGAILGYIILYFLHEQILYLLYGINSEMLFNIFNILLIAVLAGVPSILLGYPFLAALGYHKYANSSVIYGAVFYTLFVFTVTIIFHNIYYTASSLVVYEFFVLFYRIFFIKKFNLWRK